MPSLRPDDRMLRTWCVLPSRIRPRTALFATRISNAATMPPPMRGISRCDTTPDRHAASCTLIWFWRSAGNMSEMRSRACGASLVCSVANTKWPVSGDRQGELHRLGVTHLTDEDDVGVFPQRGPQRPGERVGVVADLALADRRVLVRVHVLHRVLDGEDVAAPVLVDVVDHRGEGRRLARPGRPGHQHQALGQVGEVLDRRRQAELVDGRQLERDDPQRHRQRCPSGRSSWPGTGPRRSTRTRSRPLCWSGAPA